MKQSRKISCNKYYFSWTRVKKLLLCWKTFFTCFGEMGLSKNNGLTIHKQKTISRIKSFPDEQINQKTRLCTLM